MLKFDWNVWDYTVTDTHLLVPEPIRRSSDTISGKLVPKPWPAGVGTRCYDVFRKEPDLFRRFADLEGSPESVLRFANRYGHLGIPCEQVVSYTVETVDEATGVGWRTPQINEGEPLDQWARHALAMRELIALWLAVQRADVDYLAQVVHLHGDGRVAWVERSPGSIAVGHAEGFGRGRLDEAAARYVVGEVDSAVSACLRIVPDGLRGRFEIVPDNLIGALWLQSAAWIAGDRNSIHGIQLCEHCQRAIHIGFDAKKRSTRYCSNACKVAAARRRAKATRALMADGLSPEQISERTGARVVTIQKWQHEMKGEQNAESDSKAR